MLGLKLFVLAGVEEADDPLGEVTEECAEGHEDEPQRPQREEDVFQEAGWAPFLVVVVVHGSVGQVKISWGAAQPFWVRGVHSPYIVLPWI